MVELQLTFFGEAEIKRKKYKCMLLSYTVIGGG